jgi:shikimate kinase
VPDVTWTSADEALAADRHGTTRDGLVARPVVLVGFMGVGKTSVGRELARILDRPFADTDEMVQRRSGATIPELFARGEHVFRALERAALVDALTLPGAVVAIGGGAFVQPGATELLLPRALVVHLYTPWRAMVDLLPTLAADRPLIRDNPPWRVQELFLARAAPYRRAHLRIRLDRSGAAPAAATIADVLRSQRREPETIWQPHRRTGG